MRLTSQPNSFDKIITNIEKTKTYAIKAVNANLIWLYRNVSKYLSILHADSNFGDKVIDETTVHIAQATKN